MFTDRCCVVLAVAAEVWRIYPARRDTPYDSTPPGCRTLSLSAAPPRPYSLYPCSLPTDTEYICTTVVMKMGQTILEVNQ